jgi:hypothetical protein
MHFYNLNLTVKDGFAISEIDAIINVWQIGSGTHVGLEVVGSGQSVADHNAGEFVPPLTRLMVGYTSSQAVSFSFADVVNTTCHIYLTVNAQRTATTFEQGQYVVWGACDHAAQTAWSAQQNTINAEIQQLEGQINDVETLTLRREENDEIMRCTLKWLLGTGFDFMPHRLRHCLRKGEMIYSRQ